VYVVAYLLLLDFLEREDRSEANLFTPVESLVVGNLQMRTQNLSS
jgi:hypothetical protein